MPDIQEPRRVVRRKPEFCEVGYLHSLASLHGHRYAWSSGESFDFFGKFRIVGGIVLFEVYHKFARRVAVKLIVDVFGSHHRNIVAKNVIDKLKKSTLSCLVFFRHQAYHRQYLRRILVHNLQVVHTYIVLLLEDMPHKLIDGFPRAFSGLVFHRVVQIVAIVYNVFVVDVRRNIDECFILGNTRKEVFHRRKVVFYRLSQPSFACFATLPGDFVRLFYYFVELITYTHIVH